MEPAVLSSTEGRQSGGQGIAATLIMKAQRLGLRNSMFLFPGSFQLSANQHPPFSSRKGQNIRRLYAVQVEWPPPQSQLRPGVESSRPYTIHSHRADSSSLPPAIVL